MTFGSLFQLPLRWLVKLRHSASSASLWFKRCCVLAPFIRESRKICILTGLVMCTNGFLVSGSALLVNSASRVCVINDQCMITVVWAHFSCFTCVHECLSMLNNLKLCTFAYEVWCCFLSQHACEDKELNSFICSYSIGEYVDLSNPWQEEANSCNNYLAALDRAQSNKKHYHISVSIR